MTNKLFCSACVGTCDVKYYTLKQKIVDDECYFECPRCSRVFELVVLLEDSEIDSRIIAKVHNAEEM